MENILIVVDIQNEYTTEGRPFYLKGIEPSLNKCTEMLAFARKNHWGIVHIQHSNEGREGIDRFLPGTVGYDFVPGFTPEKDEMHFVKNDFSCYSSSEFSDFMDKISQLGDKANIYMIGYNSVMCCLSTLEEARRRHHPIVFISDASYAKSLEGMSEAQTHAAMMSLYRAKKLATLQLTGAIIGA